MALSFGKLMKQADKNYKDVSSKITQIEEAKKSKGQHGPNADAVRALLEKKKALEKLHETKKLEDKQRLIENKAREARKTATKTELLKQMLKKPIEVIPISIINDKTPQKIVEQRKSDHAFKIAKERLKNDPKVPDIYPKKPIVTSSNEKIQNRQLETIDKAAGISKHKLKQHGKIPAKQCPVDFVKLMQVALKNKEEKIHYDDLVVKKSQNEKLKDAKVKPIMVNIILPTSKGKSDKSSSLNTKSKPSQANTKNNHNAKVKIKEELSHKKKLSNNANLSKSHPTNNGNVRNGLEKKSINPPAKKTLNSVTNHMNGILDSKNKSSKVVGQKKVTPLNNTLNSVTQKKKSLVLQKPVASSTNVSKNDKIKPHTVPLPFNKTTSIKPTVNKMVGSKPLASSIMKKPPTIAQSSLANNRPIKRPGTPPSTITNSPMKRPKVSSNIVRYLPTTSGQTFATKSDLQRALTQRREMMFKNPQKYQQQDDDDYDDEEEDAYDSEMDDFIDDTEYGDQNERIEYTKEIRKLFKYDPNKYKYLDSEDDRRMESSFKDIQKEEARSAKLGLLEDLQDIQREQEEMKRKMKKVR